MPIVIKSNKAGLGPGPCGGYLQALQGPAGEPFCATNCTVLRPFQKKFIERATADGIDTAALSVPRGNGKSWLAGQIIARVLNPKDDLFRAGTESVLVAASIEQARLVFRFARDMLEPLGGYRFLDSANRVAILHKATNTRLRVTGKSGRTAMGLVNCPWVIGDEPGAWETVGGQLLHDAIETAKGKPGSPLRSIYIGTLAPARSGWWHDLISRGSRGSTYVQSLRGDPKRWHKMKEIRRCNPLVDIDPAFAKKLKSERDAARADTRLKARFLSYRLNVPTADESEILISPEDWERVCSRDVPDPVGRPIVGIDLGAHRAWSAAVALWPNGRMEAIAVAPGIPSISEQEKRDLVPRGAYASLVDAGLLRQSEGLRVPPPSLLVGYIQEHWGTPHRVICDRFRLNDLKDCSMACPLETRIGRWSEAAFDIRALRKAAKDGPLSCDLASRPLVIASLASAVVDNDDQGSMRLVKRGTNNCGRDDVAAALVLAVGGFERLRQKPEQGRTSYGGLI